MELKHTKGGWVIRDLEIIGEYGSNKSICEITGNYMDEKEAMANAKLIAASPTMLETLIEVQKSFNAFTPQEVIDKVNNAIEKATVNN